MNAELAMLHATLYQVQGTRAASWNGRAVISSGACALGDLFAALPGRRTDGHQFLKEAAGAGASVLLVRRGTVEALEAGRLPWAARWTIAPIARVEDAGTAILAEVDDVLQALQTLAAHRRQSFGGRVIAVTGSYGKTTTKEILRQVLPGCEATAGNLNNHIGLPLSILSADTDARFWVLEMGMNHPGELTELAAIAVPDEVVYTPLGLAHAGEADGDWIPEAKTELLRTDVPPARVYVPADEDGYAAWLSHYQGEIVRYSSGVSCAGSRWKIASLVEDFPAGCTAELVYEDQALQVRWDVPYEEYVAAVCAGLEVCVSQSIGAATTSLALSAVLGNRMRVIHHGDDIWLVNDGYNASPETMESGAEWCERRLQDGWNVRALLGDMLELGDHAPAEHIQVLRRFASVADLDVMCVTPSDEMAAAAAALSLSVVTVPVDEPASWLEGLAAPGILYAKASNGTGIGRALQAYIAHREIH